ncbi:conserved Plasmodium protein, unknown function [Plasmodium malariae]|uniref:Uncharacterized protein n=1 Tax=Plasmodium malariae TaxID=5858 RepID=A0A1C3KZG7_PLAMA|nr:conserved Plasmodium protein, unknown function [Plasmodium malariae]
MFRYVIFGISGSVSGWVLRDIVICLVNNVNSTNGILLNKFICSKDDYVKNTSNELKYCFDQLELSKGFNNYNIYLKEKNYFVETLYIEKWNNIKNLSEHMHSEKNKEKLHYLQKMNIHFSPSLFVLLKQYNGIDTPEYLKNYFS